MAIPMVMCPEPWKSRPLGLRFEAIEKGASAPVRRDARTLRRFR